MVSLFLFAYRQNLARVNYMHNYKYLVLTARESLTFPTLCPPYIPSFTISLPVGKKSLVPATAD